MQVTRLEDEGEIFAFLRRDRLYAAYAIGALKPSLFEQYGVAAIGNVFTHPDYRLSLHRSLWGATEKCKHF